MWWDMKPIDIQLDDWQYTREEWDYMQEEYRKDFHSFMQRFKSLHIAVDIDGVLADFEGSFRAFCENALGRTLKPATKYDFTDWGLKRNTVNQLHSVFIMQGEYRDIRAIGGALKGINALLCKGYTVTLLTHRGRDLSKEDREFIKEDTYYWLGANGLGEMTVDFAKDDKSAYEFDLIVDDSPGVIYDVSQNSRNFIVFDQPYNQNVAGPRALNWLDVQELVHART